MTGVQTCALPISTVVVTVTPSNHTFSTVNQNQTYSAILTVNGQVTPATFTWSLSNSSVGFNIGDSTGGVTANATGQYASSVIATVVTPVEYAGKTGVGNANASIANITSQDVNVPVTPAYTLQINAPRSINAGASAAISATVYLNGLPTDIPVSFDISDNTIPCESAPPRTPTPPAPTPPAPTPAPLPTPSGGGGGSSQPGVERIDTSTLL